MQNITVGIVEDNPQLGQDIRDKLALCEEVEVLFEVRSGMELLKTLKFIKPKVLLMDIQMAEMDGVEATWQTKKQYPDLKILMLTVMDDEQKLFEALQAGASGYLLKDAKPHQLFNAIDNVIEGGLPLSPSLAGRVLDYLKNSNKISTISLTNNESLTKREHEILELLIQGRATKQISEMLFVSDKTIRKHFENIFKKLQVHSFKELIAKLNSVN